MSERIIINEIDETTPPVVESITDIVYVPGFAVKCTVNNDTYTIAEADEKYRDTAVLFENVDDFTKAFGDMPYYFTDGTCDYSYEYAKALLTAGLPVLFEAVYTGVVTKTAQEQETIVTADKDKFLDKLKTAEIDTADGFYSKLADKGMYEFKYLTSGGWPIFNHAAPTTDKNVTTYAENNIAKEMIKCATSRGDCIALIDHKKDTNNTLPLTGQNSIYEGMKYFADEITALNAAAPSSIYNMSTAAFFTPWATYGIAHYIKDTENEGKTKQETTIDFAPSYAYLRALAASIKTNASWLAIAGVTRGVVPGLKTLNTSKILTNAIADSYQDANAKISLNAITEIRDYGKCIWGNRTARDNTKGSTATSFLNIRNLMCEVKKEAYKSAMRCLFEQDTEILWVNFTAPIRALLDYMMSNQGISNYKIIRKTTTDKTKMACAIRLYPIYALESIEIDVVLTEDNQVTVG